MVPRAVGRQICWLRIAALGGSIHLQSVLTATLSPQHTSRQLGSFRVSDPMRLRESAVLCMSKIESLIALPFILTKLTYPLAFVLSSYAVTSSKHDVYASCSPLSGAADRSDYADAFTVRWKEEDLSTLTSPSPVFIPSRTGIISHGTDVAIMITLPPGATWTGAPGSMLIADTGDDSSSIGAGAGGLSSGAKAGIGIGAALGVLALLAVIGFLIFRRRRKSRTYMRDTHHDAPIPYDAAEKMAELPVPVRNIESEPSLPEAVTYQRATHNSTKPHLAELSSSGHQTRVSPVAELPSSQHQTSIPQITELSAPSPLETGAVPEVVPESGLELDTRQQPPVNLAQTTAEQRRRELTDNLTQIQERRQRLMTIHAMEEEENRIRRELEHLDHQ
jgi:hypothetical protein